MHFLATAKAWSLGKPKGKGLLGNKKRGLSLRGGEHNQNKKRRKKRGEGFKKKKKRLYSHAILHWKGKRLKKGSNKNL